MSRKRFYYFGWLVGVIVLVVFLFWFLDIQIAPRETPEATSQGAVSSLGSTATTTDGVTVATASVVDTPSSSMQMVFNSAARYRVAVPMSWYVEKNGVTGITLYPDYSVGGAPSCKIEISVLPNKENFALGDWLAAYLRQDPTADIAETSQMAMEVSGRAAIRWAGSLNGVSTTLVYVSGDGVVYEMAPSGIAASNQKPATSDCDDELETILKNFTITSP